MLLTVDKGIAHQQSMIGRKISLLVIGASSNKQEDLLPHIPACLAALTKIGPGEVVRAGEFA